VIKPAQGHRIDIEQQAEIVVPHVVEVPARAEVPATAGIAGNPGLPARMVNRHLDVVGDIGERQTFGGEAHRGTAGVGGGTEVAAHAEVMGEAPVGVKRKLSARGGAGDVGDVGAGRLRDRRQPNLPEFVAAEGRLQTEHRRLLLDLGIATQDGEARPSRQLGHDVRRLPLDASYEAGIGQRVVEVGEHQVLPDENPELVT
jgi:hypothetical protein